MRHPFLNAFLAMLCFVEISQAQENPDSLQTVRKRLMQTLERFGEYDWELENSTKVLDSLQSLPASMKPPAAPIYKLGKVYLQAANHQMARKLFAAYKAHPKATETGQRLIQGILDNLRVSDSVDATLEKVKDPRDGRAYRVVKIGTSRWMAENLSWEAPGSFCSSNKEKWCRVYGRLYDFAGAREACMPGWRLPAQEDWTDLLASQPDAVRLKGPELGGDNLSGFHALPGGSGYRKGTEAMSRGQSGHFWEDQESDGSLSSRRFEEGESEIERIAAARDALLGVRCVEGAKGNLMTDSAPEVSRQTRSRTSEKELKDPRDGRVYPIVRIGGRDWMGANLAWSGTDGKLGACSSDKPRECAKDGRMYDWSTAMALDPKFNRQDWGLNRGSVSGICPSGWFLPRREDLLALDSVSSILPEDRGGLALKSRKGWDSLLDGTSGNGTDKWRFDARPTGYRRGHDGRPAGKGERALFWTSGDLEGRKAFVLLLDYVGSRLDSTTWPKEDLLPIRCLR